MKIRSIALIVVGLLWPLLASAAGTTGIQGRAAWRGVLVPDIEVRAYRSIEDIAAGKAVATSPASALDGTYKLELPPGQYYLTAQDFSGAPQPGKHFCYYSGAPVRVRAGHFSNVGFNLIRIPQEETPQQGGFTGIHGEVSYLDQPLERVYLYVYKGAADGFKGPGYTIVPVERGTFRLRLPPGEYYLLVRKRAKGGRFGPIEVGDYFNYYYGNPVTIAPGMSREVKIEAITRLSMLEGEEIAPVQEIRGSLRTVAGQPATGVRVFAYRDAAMTGTPAFFSPPADAQGRFVLPIDLPGRYYLVARESFGGPAAPGEFYGRYGGEQGKPVEVREGATLKEVTIDVQRR